MNCNTVQLPEGIKLAQRAEKVFKVSNNIMEVFLSCPYPKQDCFECGNAKCFEAMRAQAEIYEMTFDEYVNAIKRMQAEDVERVKKQKERFECYPVKRRAKVRKVADRIAKQAETETSPGLFDFDETT